MHCNFYLTECKWPDGVSPEVNTEDFIANLDLGI